MLATRPESPARVNSTNDSSSESGASRERRDLPRGYLYVGNFGDCIGMKQDNILRIGFQNVGGFLAQCGKIKEDNIRQGLLKWEFDFFGMVEMNLDWRVSKESEKLPARTREWWDQQYVSWAHNRTSYPYQARQYGGTALFAANKAAHRAIEKGIDDSGLGQWTWTRFTGKGNQTLRILVAYRPNPPLGPFTVYAQQNAFFHSISRDVCPRHAFLADLSDELKKFLDLGDHIIILIDGNSNMKGSDLSRAFTQLSLSEAILGRHGTVGPATHKRNSTQTPIDGIWVSPGIQIERGGYFEYDEVIPSDHCYLWVDLSFTVAFGHNMPPLCKRQPRRLHCKDPRLVENYIKLFHQFAGTLNLFQRVKSLEQHAPFMSKFDAIHEYEVLDSLRCKATVFAKKH
jgi:hypothetical protein